MLPLPKWKILLTWLLDVANQDPRTLYDQMVADNFPFAYAAQIFIIQPATFFLTIHILHCFMTQVNLNEMLNKIQCYGAAALGLASLYSDKYDIILETLSFVCDGNASVSDLVKAQKEIFMKVGTQLHLPTSWDHLMKILEDSYNEEELSNLIKHDLFALLAAIEIVVPSLGAQQSAELAYCALEGITDNAVFRDAAQFIAHDPDIKTRYSSITSMFAKIKYEAPEDERADMAAAANALTDMFGPNESPIRKVRSLDNIFDDDDDNEFVTPLKKRIIDYNDDIVFDKEDLDSPELDIEDMDIDDDYNEPDQADVEPPLKRRNQND
jgi:hypothetical protein